MTTATLPVADPAMVAAEARRLLRAHRRMVSRVVVLHLIAVALGLVPPFLLGVIVGHVADQKQVHVDVIGAAILGCVLTQGGFVYFARRAAFLLGEMVFADLRESFVARVLRMPLPEVERVGAGEILSRSTDDMESIHDLVRTGLPETVAGILTCMLTVAVALVVDPALGWTTIVGIPIILLATRYYSPRLRRAYAGEFAARSAMSTAVIESAQGAAVTNAFGLTERRQQIVSGATGRARTASLLPISLSTRWFPLVQIGYFLPLLVTLVVGARMVTTGRAGVGELTTIALYTMALVSPLDDLANWFDEFQGASAALARIVGSPPPESPAPADARVPVDGEVVVRGLSFGYLARRTVLSDLDLTIPSATRVAVVGPSGAGKSTLALLIAGVLTPAEGSVLVGGADVAQLAEAELRRHVALITQDTHVFRGSAASNLRLVDPDADDDAIRRALRVVGADRWIDELEGSIHADLGEDAYLPTPQQAQRLSLARIVLRPPQVVILDEATSALPRTMVNELDTVLDRALAGRTIIQIVHRLDTASRADLIMVLDDGRVVEAGTHDALVASGGQYSSMWRLWSGAARTTG